MTNSERPSWLERHAAQLAGLILLASLGLGFSSALQKSATRDEGVHLARGIAFLKTGDPRLSIHHPPLMNLLSALPLFLFGRTIVFPDQDPSWLSADKDRFAEILAQANRPNLLRFLQLGRLPTLLLSALLGGFVFRFSRELFGTHGGLLSLALYAFDPTILAHSRLITTDLAVTAGTFFVIMSLWRFYQTPSCRRLVILSLCLGLALLTKYSALILVPVSALVLAAGYGLDQDFRAKLPLTRGAWFLALGVIILLLVLWAGYLFELSPWPWSRYLNGFLATEKLLHHGPNYFLGQIRDSGFRSYYLVLFLLKTPLGSLLLLALSLAPNQTPSPRRLNLLPLFIFTPVIAFFLAASFLNDLNLGVRYVLPAYPLLFLFCGRIFYSAAPLPRWKKFSAPALAGWTIAASLWIWPDYLMYWNPLAGGPDRAWRIAVAGEDWGQDLPGLARYVREHQIDDLHYNVYGIGMPSLYGLRYRTFPCYTPVKGWVAVHMVDLFRPRQAGCYDWLKAYPPVAKIGWTIWIYRIE